MKQRLAFILCVALLALGLPALAYSQSRPAEVIGSATQTLQLEVSKGNLIRLEKPAGTAFIADPPADSGNSSAQSPASRARLASASRTTGSSSRRGGSPGGKNSSTCFK